MKPELKEILSFGSLAAAPLLLGCIIGRRTPLGLIKARIVETEAYHQNDEASHSWRGRTARTSPMFEAGGRLYIYFNYGMHYAINIVTGPAGVGEAVLIRAAEPVSGLEVMKGYRPICSTINLTNGPAKLAQAFGITDTSLSGELLNKSSIFLQRPSVRVKQSDIIVGRRIGISRADDRLWRFYLKNNAYVSKPSSR